MNDIYSSTYYQAALKKGIHTTVKHIETRRNGNQWHAPLRSFDAEARRALKGGLGRLEFVLMPAGGRAEGNSQNRA